MRHLVFLLTLFLGLLGKAQNTYQDLVVGRYPPPWSELYNVQQESESLLEKVELGLKAVSAREQQVLQAKAELGNLGYDAQSFFTEIVRMVEENRPDLARSQLIQAGAQQAEQFFKEYENLNRDTFDLTMALVFHHLRASVAEKKWSTRDLAALKKKWQDMDNERLSYAANRDQYKKSKDTYRTTPYKKFFILARNLSQFVQSRGSFSERVHYRLEKLNKTWQSLKFLPAVFPHLRDLIRQIFARVQPTADHNPLISTVNKAATLMTQKLGRTFQIEGADLLPAKVPPPGEVNMYISSHRDALMDQAAMAAMGLDHVTPFAAVNNFVPEALNHFFGFKFRVIRHLNANYAVVIVGRGADPKAIPKAIEILLKSGVRNFMIYPEGRLPEGLGATAGVRDDFFSEKGAIHAIEKAGYKVNLVVSSLIDNAGLFDGPSLTAKDSIYRIKVHGVIRDEIRREIMKHGGELGLAMLLEYGLIETLVTNERLMFGQVRPSKIKEMVLDEYVLGKSCRSAVGP